MNAVRQFVTRVSASIILSTSLFGIFWHLSLSLHVVSPIILLTLQVVIEFWIFLRLHLLICRFNCIPGRKAAILLLSPWSWKQTLPPGDTERRCYNVRRFARLAGSEA